MQGNQFFPGIGFYRFLVSVLLLYTLTPATAQQGQTIAGDFAGTLGSLHIKLHVRIDPAGNVSATLDSTDQGAFVHPCTDVHLDGQSLSFSVPEVHGTWKGAVTDDGLDGESDQGAPRPLYFAREAATTAATPSAVDGIWLGTLNTDNRPLRIQLHVHSDANGKEFCTVDSLDRRAMGLVCAKVRFASTSFSFELPAVRESWTGTLSENGNVLSGVWNQGNPQPLILAWSSALAAAPRVAFDPAMPPVSVVDLKSVLDSDLAAALQDGQLAPSTATGISIGVCNTSAVFSATVLPNPTPCSKLAQSLRLSPASPSFNSSSRATFTWMIPFAHSSRQGLLPNLRVMRSRSSTLVTQHSGLPLMPDNLTPADPSNPYADYGSSNLYAFLAKQTVAKPAKPDFLYSNLGFGLLGQALAVHSSLSYPDLLKKQVTDPLGLKDTTVSLSSDQLTRFIPGHSADHRPAHAWDLDALAGAGAIRSTAPDMLEYLEVNLHPEAIKADITSEPGSTLAAALMQQHVLRADAGGTGMKIGFAWLFDVKAGNYWHNGGTGGYSSFAFFNPQTDSAAIVLANNSPDHTGSFADRLGEHIIERLTGKPAVSLAN